MAKGWNITFWVKNREGQVFAKITYVQSTRDL